MNEHHFVDIGLRLFADVLGRFFAPCVNSNCFTRLRLASARTGDVLILCERRAGERARL